MTWYKLEKHVIFSILANCNFKRETGPLSIKLLEDTIGSLCELCRDVQDSSVVEH